MDNKKILSLPKTELHCHLDGSLSLSCMENLLGRKISRDEIEVSSDCKDLAMYLEKFRIPLLGLQTSKGLKIGAKTFLEDIAKENVRYVEVRFSPILSTNDNLSTRDVIESVLDGLNEAKNEIGVEFGVIASLMRHHDEKTNLEMTKLAKEYLGYGLCAIDLAGNEAAYPTRDFKEIFALAKSLSIPFTIHAGECGDVKNVVDAIDFGAKRVGHGIALRGNAKEIEYARKNKIGIEMCPISNLQTKAVKSINDYPIREFLNNDLLVTINTDNRTVSNTSLTKELLFIKENFGITDEEIIRILQNSINVSFANDKLKHSLKDELLKSI